MAEHDDDADRSEEPTQKKLEDAHEKGNVAKSQEVNAWFVLSGATLVLLAFGQGLAGGIAGSFGGLLATASSVHAVMAAGIKLPYCWGWDEVFPARFSAVNDRWRTPHWSLLTLFVVSTGLTFWTSGLDQVIEPLSHEHQAEQLAALGGA